MKTKKKFFIIIISLIAFALAFECVLRVAPIKSEQTDFGDFQVGKKAIALTFDDGPADNTARLLNGLAQYNAKATFFVLGCKAEKNPELVKRAYDEGHLIANHTYDHPRLTLKSLTEARRNIEASAEIIEEITGEKPAFVRPPHGDLWAYQLKSLDYYFVNWSVNTFDWDAENSDDVYERIMNNAEDGAIILLHDTKETTVDAVLKAIPELLAQGYELVRVDELLARNGSPLSKGVTYRKCEDNKSAFVF